MSFAISDVCPALSLTGAVPALKSLLADLKDLNKSYIISKISSGRGARNTEWASLNKEGNCPG